MTDTPERDSLDELLAPPSPVDAEALRQALLITTLRRLRRGRRLRRAVLVAALAACYGAGLLTMRLPTPAQSAAAPVVEEHKEAPPPAPVAVAPEPAPAVERRAEQAPAPERAALLRRAGERYLNEEGDPESALRCYTKSLDAGTKDDAKFSPQDDWLLMAIKNAREKEARHANDDG